MRKIAYIFTGDFGHPKDTILPLIPKLFDPEQWHTCVMDSIEDILLMPSAPDLLVSFQVGNSGIIDHKPSWYESSPFTYQWMKWVRENGCGLLLVHGGLCFIPEDHPVILQGTIGHFAGHPAACPVHVEPDVKIPHPVTQEVEAFDLPLDEHFQIEGIDPDQVSILAWSTSEAGGCQPAVWVHEVGKGRVAVITLGHASVKERPLEHPELLKLVKRAAAWCGQNC